MLRKMIEAPGGLAHYLVGSVYVMACLVTIEREARALSR